MQVKIFTSRGIYHTKEITHCSELNQIEIAGSLLRIRHLNESLNHYNFSVDFTPEHIFKRTLEVFVAMKKECIAELQMTISEHYEPRDMTPETGWDNQPIVKHPFVLEKTIALVKEKIFSMSQNIALAKKVNIFDKEQMSMLEKERQDVLNFIPSFTPLFQSIYSGVTLEIDHNEHSLRIEKNISELKNQNIKFESVNLRPILQEISSIEDDLELFGPRFEIYERNFNNKEIEQIHSLLAVVEFLEKLDNKKLTFFDFFFSAFTGKILKLIRTNKLLFRFKSFEQYFENQRSEIILNKSVYDSQEDINKRLKSLQENKSNMKENFLRDFKKMNDDVVKISKIIQNWCDIFNTAFSENDEQKFIQFVNLSDCKIASVENEHFVALALKDPDGMIYQYRGIVLPEKNLQGFKNQDKSMSDYLLKDLDILNKNPEKINSTSFHNIDNILDEINRGVLKDFVFKNVDEKVLFTA